MNARIKNTYVPTKHIGFLNKHYKELRNILILISKKRLLISHYPPKF